MFVMSVSGGENERLKMAQRWNQHMFSCFQKTLKNENKGQEPKFAVQNNATIWWDIFYLELELDK